ncbi:MAG: SRPBCC family protein [Verrucomicrobia bacterium]|nr:SRPBCC family protein [Verrucomicrobiota bacterium]
MDLISHIAEMTAPPAEVFTVVSDLAAWPRYLPHYRWIRVTENHPDHQVMRMACYHGWIPVDWLTRFHADSATKELHFEHQNALTRGMRVVWRLEPIRDGAATRVTIRHDMGPVAQRWGDFMSERIFGRFFIHPMAARTLESFAEHFRRKAASAPP